MGDERKTHSQLFVRVIAARGLTSKGEPDPYCAIFLDKEKKHKTPTLKKTGDPIFEEEKAKIFNLNSKHEELRIVLKDDTFLLPDSFLGQVTFSLHSLEDGVPHDEWYSVESRPGKKDKVQGELHLQVMFTERPDGNIGDDDFSIPAQILLKKGKMQVLKNMLEKSTASLSIQDKDGNTPLHFAALHDNVEAVTLLLKKGADVKSKNAKGQTPLHVAAEKSPGSIPALLEGKSDVEAKDSDKEETGKRPLHVAALSNNGKACQLLLEKGVSINGQTDKGNTALHLALRANAFEAVKILASQRKIDIYKRNKEGQHSAHIALKLGGDVKRIFMDSVRVEDDREFDIVDSGFKKRHRIEGENLANDFLKSNQFLLRSNNKTDTKIVCHFIGNGAADAAVSKVGFCVVTTNEGKHTEASYQTNCVGYGTQEPLALTLEAGAKYAVLPYAAELETKGKFSILVFTKEDDEVELKPLVAWKHTVSEKGEWKGNSAGGCNREDTWVNNPRYLLKLPADKKEVELYILLAQQKSTLDIIPFQVHPYAFHIGYYIYNKDVDDIIDRSVWQNAREVYKYVKFDTTKEIYRELVIVPTTVKAGQETPFTITVFSDEPVDLERVKAAKIIDVNK